MSRVYMEVSVVQPEGWIGEMRVRESSVAAPQPGVQWQGWYTGLMEASLAQPAHWCRRSRVV